MNAKLADVKAHLRLLRETLTAMEAVAASIDSHTPEALKDPSTSGVKVTPSKPK